MSHDILPAIVSVAFIGGAILPIILKMVFRHQVQMEELSVQQASPPEVVAEIKELRKQVSDLRELVMDIALQPSSAKSVQQRVQQDN